MTTKTCATCKHLIGVRSNLTTAASWKCGAPANVQKEWTDLVTGESKQYLQYSDCYAARGTGTGFGCGEVGAWHEIYVYTPYIPPAQAAAPKPAKAQVSLEMLDDGTTPEQVAENKERAAKILADLRESRRANKGN